MKIQVKRDRKKERLEKIMMGEPVSDTDSVKEEKKK